jgi:solute:Na+ symporter, SSS family
MELNQIDWLIVLAYFVLALVVGLVAGRNSGTSASEFFGAGGKMPWWLLGLSMVATTFSTDTPNLVTDIVRKDGVAGNWSWWAFLLTGMLTVFVYARLWKRIGVLTDIEFYELRYSGKYARFLRGFRALYLGFFFNVVIMATVSLAAIKIGGILLGLSPVETILIASIITVIYSAIGGLRGVLFTDLLLFVIAMAGSIATAIVAVQHPKVGGLQKLLQHEAVIPKLPMMPDFSDPSAYIPLLLVPLLVQWWSVWYPGAEPGGGGYIAQRMLAAKDEKNAIGSVFLFNLAHYALRPWPWIIVALASLIVYPDLASLAEAFPNAAKIDDDIAYSAMLTFLPHGLLGLVVTSLIAAYMSTISTHLNWGASYIVNDWYKRFIKPESDDRELVRVGQISTVVLMIVAGVLALFLESALGSFNILLQIGAGTGLIFILRWFWWRINAAGELAAMTISFVVALFFEIAYKPLGLPDLESWQKLVIGVAVTTVGWLAVVLLTKPDDEATLLNFVKIAKPGGAGWKRFMTTANEPIIGDLAQHATKVPQGIVAMIYGSVAIYSLLMATGYWIYADIKTASLLTLLGTVASVLLFRQWKKM